MYAKNLLITFLGFLIALTAYFNSQSGIKEPFLGMHIRGAAVPQQVISNGRGGFSTNTTSSRLSKTTIYQTHRTKYALDNMRARENYHAQRSSENYKQTSRGSLPTFAVPGTYQSNLSPRIQPQPYSCKYKL